MSQQCPACSSWNEASAAFCSQCGGALVELRPARRRRRRGPVAVVGLLLLAVVGVAVVSWLGDEPGPARERETAVRPAGGDSPAPHATGSAGEPEAGDPPRDPSPPERVAEGSGPAPETPELRDDRDAAFREAQGALVVLELHGARDRPLGDTRGLLVQPGDRVLCRLSPLLGAARGSCRLPGFRQPRRAVAGVVARDEGRDLALLAVDTQPGDPSGLPLLEEPPGRVLVPGDPVFLVPAREPRELEVERTGASGPGGRAVVRLDARSSVPSESFAAVDVAGFVVGLVHIATGAETGTGGERWVDPVHELAPQVDSPVAMSLGQLTDLLYTGTFPDLLRRGERAWRREAWSDALDLLARAVERIETDGAEPAEAERARTLLRESALREANRLRQSGRTAEAAAVASAALERFPDDPALWTLLGDVRLQRGEHRAGIDALLEARILEPAPRLDERLEAAYIAFARGSRESGDDRQAEAALLEGIEQLPRSGRLHLELGRLYESWEAWDAAVRLLRTAAELDGSLSDQVALRLERIDDAIKRRDAVVIPIEDGLIRTKAVVDGRFEFPFIVDTGASHTTVPRSFAEELGYDVSRGERVRLRTAGGTVVGHRLRFAAVELRGYVVRNIEVVVLPPSIGLDEGLLGLNFLRHFRYGVDSRRREFRIEPP